jgi:hypothetical protein
VLQLNSIIERLSLNYRSVYIMVKIPPTMFINKLYLECNNGYNGYFGDYCANQYNTHCKEGDIICRHTDGECLNGCKAEWNGVRVK